MRLNLKLAFASFILALPLVSYPIPAKPGISIYTQPDGSNVKIMICGDENNHYYKSEDGYPLVDNDNSLYFATLDKDGHVIASNILAQNIDVRNEYTVSALMNIDKDKILSLFKSKTDKRLKSTGKPNKAFGLFENSSFPRFGQQKALVILVEFSDIKFQDSYDPTDYFFRLLNEPDFNDLNGSGSASDYFIENSKGVFKPEFDVFGPITLSKPSYYYGANNINGSDLRPAQMIIDACKSLDNEIDFSTYDRDNDGNIDNVFVFYAGRGEASGGLPSTIWPHSWDVNNAVSEPIVLDGKTLGRYACTNEWDGEKPDGIGTFVHEFSHVLGLPDLYATSYSNAFTPGAWSVMDHGSYNNDSRTPPYYSAFERYALGWIQPTYINGTQSIEIENIAQNVAFVIPTSCNEEKFFLENRQQCDWDEFIPGHGMLIWHVTYNQNIWQQNTVNNSPSNQYVDLIEADNQLDDNREGDAFPGSQEVTTVSVNTHSDMTPNLGEIKDFTLRNICENNGIIQLLCDFLVDEIPSPGHLRTEYISATSFNLRWGEIDNADNYFVSVSQLFDDTHNGILKLEDGLQLFETGNVNSTIINGLKPNCNYVARVYAANNGYLSKASEPLSVTTSSEGIGLYNPVAYAPENIKPTSIIARWEPYPQALDFQLSVFEIVNNGSYSELNSFDNGIKLDNNWATSTLMTGKTDANSGQSPPSLMFASNGGYIDTPIFHDDIKSINFWYKTTQSGMLHEPLIFSIYGLNNNEFQKLTSYKVLNYGTAEHFTFDITAEGIKQIRLRIEAASGTNCYIDDMSISYGNKHTDELVSGFPKLVGNCESFLIEGLSPETSYYYELRASDGVTFSAPSNRINFTTTAADTGSSWAGTIKSDDITIKKTGLGIIIHNHEEGYISIYDIYGHLIFYNYSPSDHTQFIPINNKGIYIIKTDKATQKITF